MSISLIDEFCTMLSKVIYVQIAEIDVNTPTKKEYELYPSKNIFLKQPYISQDKSTNSKISRTYPKIILFIPP